ncbi:Peroxisome bioproteinsis factor 10 [Hibiscus syriacus]|uniref:RING-type E3 ubiquitin transferase n=1 Tax=Hibiscus syriacus TaxID=106335 RepID=A0A6A2WR97_HIBSY|nr:Peroxisome bioproteinsis factor 10 [Hibiscus syriacus]
MGSGRNDSGGSGNPGPSGESEPSATVEPRRFPLAAQPEIMRAAEKDDQYASFVYDACRDAFRHLFGTRVAVAYQNETKLLGQMLYYVLTTGSGQQTLGEECCDITQMLPIARELLQWVLRANLMFFYFEGLYYHISKRASGIRYVFIGKPSNQRPRSATQQLIFNYKLNSSDLIGDPSKPIRTRFACFKRRRQLDTNGG